MKTKRVSGSFSYSSEPKEFVVVWERLLPYVKSYPFEIDKVIWVGELEHQTVSVFPGSPGDADDPDVPVAFTFDIPDLWSSEPDDVSEDDAAFRRAYNKRKKWLIKTVKSSWQQFDDRQLLLDEGIGGKLGVYLAEFWECLSLPALTFVCGTRVKVVADDNDQIVDNFCKKHDVERKYFFPIAPRRRDIIYLCGERMNSATFVRDLVEFMSHFPDRRKIYVGHWEARELPEKRRAEIQKATGIKVEWLSDAKDDAFLESVESHERRTG